MFMRVLDPCAPPDLRHLRRLTDDVGIIQHTERDLPRLEFGYAIDDVARALIVVLEAERLFPGQAAGTEGDARDLGALADCSLAFIAHCQRADGRFHNFVVRDRSFHDDAESLDAYGRTLWALGVAIRHAQGHPSCRARGERAEALFRRALPHLHALPDLRAKAFTLLGLLAVLADGDPFGVSEHAAHLVGDLLHAFDDGATDAWPWFEDTLRYSNGALPYALLAAVRSAELTTRNSGLAHRAHGVGLRSLDFLLRTLVADGVPAPIGNRGWYQAGGERALYDQQCVDAAAMVVASAEAFQLTGDARYRDAAHAWWSWFFGRNTQHRALYRPEDGAVYDGLTPEGVNENRGAESVLAFLIAHLKLADAFCKAT